MAVATTGSITIQQLFRHPAVLKVVSRVKAAGNPLASFYGLGVGDMPTERAPAGIRTFAYDIYNNTRRLGTVRSPKVGPHRVRAQKVGTGTGTVMRMYESLPVYLEDICNMRPVGSKIGTLDKTGQGWVARQIKTKTQTFMNTREWCISRVFRGGYGLSTTDGDTHVLTEYGSGTKNVDMQLPAAHKTYLAVGDSSANILDASWQTATTDVIGQLMRLNKAAMRISGWPIEYIWINSTTAAYLLNNTKMQAQGGTAFRTWESLNWRKMDTTSGEKVYSGMDIQFRAAPQFTFKVYDGVLQKPDALADSTAEAENDLIIPNDRAIFTPAPSSEWLGFVEGTEPMIKRTNAEPEMLTGFNTWQRTMLDPSGWELLFLDNFMPAAYVPTAWFYGTTHGM